MFFHHLIAVHLSLLAVDLQCRTSTQIVFTPFKTLFAPSHTYAYSFFRLCCQKLLQLSWHQEIVQGKDYISFCYNQCFVARYKSFWLPIHNHRLWFFFNIYRTHGIFRLTTPGGMSVIRKCPHRGFHPHDQPPDGGPIYNTCADIYMNPNLKFEVIDLR